MRTLAVFLTAPLLGVALSGAPVAQASQVKVADAKVTLSRTTVAVASLNTVPVTVTVEGSGHGESVYVRFKRVSGSGPEDEFYSMPLKLVDGDGTPGLWRGTLNVPSTADGTIEPDAVYSGEYIYGVDPGDPDPVVNAPVLTVNGFHVPKLTALITPKIVPYSQPWTIRYTVTDSQTGKPYGTKLKLWVREDNQCVESLGAETSLTDAAGNFTVKYAASPNNDWLHCMLLPGKPAPVGSIFALVKRPAGISATPSRTSAPVGTIVPVNGTVTKGGGCPVNLQRLYGASAWRTVGTAKVRSSGRFTLNAQPAYKGNIPYRAQLPACYNKVAGVSKTFTIRGL